MHAGYGFLFVFICRQNGSSESIVGTEELMHALLGLTEAC